MSLKRADSQTKQTDYMLSFGHSSFSFSQKLKCCKIIQMLYNNSKVVIHMLYNNMKVGIKQLYNVVLSLVTYCHMCYCDNLTLPPRFSVCLVLLDCMSAV